MGLIRLILLGFGVGLMFLSLIIHACSFAAQNFIELPNGMVSGVFAGCNPILNRNEVEYICSKYYAYLRKGSMSTSLVVETPTLPPTANLRPNTRAMSKINKNSHKRTKNMVGYTFGGRSDFNNMLGKVGDLSGDAFDKLKDKVGDIGNVGDIIGGIGNVGDIIGGIGNVGDIIGDIDNIGDITGNIRDNLLDRIENEDVAERVEGALFKPTNVLNGMVYVDIFDLFYDSSDSSEIKAIHIMSVFTAILIVGGIVTGGLSLLFKNCAYPSATLAGVATILNMATASVITYYINYDKKNNMVFATSGSLSMLWVSIVAMIASALLMSLTLIF